MCVFVQAVFLNPESLQSPLLVQIPCSLDIWHQGEALKAFFKVELRWYKEAVATCVDFLGAVAL